MEQLCFVCESAIIMFKLYIIATKVEVLSTTVDRLRDRSNTLGEGKFVKPLPSKHLFVQ